MHHDGAVMVTQEPESAAPSPGVPPPGREEQTRGIDKITTFPIDGGRRRGATERRGVGRWSRTSTTLWLKVGGGGRQEGGVGLGGGDSHSLLAVA